MVTIVTADMLEVYSAAAVNVVNKTYACKMVCVCVCVELCTSRKIQRLRCFPWREKNSDFGILTSQFVHFNSTSNMAMWCENM